MMKSDRRCASWRVAMMLAALFAGGPALAASAGASSHAAPAGPDVFGTIALPVDKTRYEARWQRAMAGAPSDSLRSLAGRSAASSPRQRLFYVQAAVNRAIAFRADRDARGHDDHWATPAETLSSRTGDCEDVAILKLQALRRLGFAPGDLYLSIGKDRSRGDHALALVRLDGRYWVLDNLGSAPVRAESHRYFEPMFTLAEGGSWLHGRRIAAASGGSALARAR